MANKSDIHKEQGRAKTARPLIGRRDNPSNTLFTLNPALSLPYVKYYTSFMQEYVTIEALTSNTSDSIDRVEMDLKSSVFPSYLRYKPYTSINEFPIMKIYKGDKEFRKAGSKRKTLLQDVRNNESKNIGILEAAENPFEAARSTNADVILTYKAVNPSIGNSKLAELGYGRYEEKSDISLLNRLTASLSTNMILKTSTDSPVGNFKTISGYMYQYLHSVALHFGREGIPGTGKNEVGNEPHVYRYELMLQHAKKQAKDILRVLDAPTNRSDNSANFRERIRGLAEDAVKVYDAINTSTLVDTLSVNIEVSDKHIFKSYLVFQAFLVAINTKIIAALMGEYINNAERLGAIISNSGDINQRALDSLADLLADVTNLKDVFTKYKIPKFTYLKFAKVNNFNYKDKNSFSKRFNIWLSKRIAGVLKKGPTKNLSERELADIYNDKYKRRYSSALHNISNMIHYIYSIQNSIPKYDSVEIESYDHPLTSLNVNSGPEAIAWWDSSVASILETLQIFNFDIDATKVVGNDTIVKAFVSEIINNAYAKKLSPGGILAQALYASNWLQEMNLLNTPNGVRTYSQYSANTGETATQSFNAFRMELEHSGYINYVKNYVDPYSNNFNFIYIELNADTSVKPAPGKTQEETIALVDNAVSAIPKSVKDYVESDTRWGWGWVKITLSGISMLALKTFRRYDAFELETKNPIAYPGTSIVNCVKDYFLMIDSKTPLPWADGFLDPDFMYRTFNVSDLTIPANYIRATNTSITSPNMFHENATVKKSGTDGWTVITTNLNHNLNNVSNVILTIKSETNSVYDSEPGTGYSEENNTLKIFDEYSFQIKTDTDSVITPYTFTSSNYALKRYSRVEDKYDPKITNVPAKKEAFGNETYVKDCLDIMSKLGIVPETTDIMLTATGITIDLASYFSDDLMNSNNTRLDETKIKEIAENGFSPTSEQHAIVVDGWSEGSGDFTEPTWEPVGFTSMINEEMDYGKAIARVNSGFISLMTLIKPIAQDYLLKFKNLTISNRDAKDGDNKNIQTTITRFDVQMQNRNIPIYMDGHDGPLIQNFGGPRVEMNMSLITNDVFLIENISNVAQELDLSYRTRNEDQAPSPLNSSFATFSKNIQTNSLVYNNTRKAILKRLNNAAGINSPIISGNMDSPILITNNVANMMGVYGCVIQSIETGTVPGFPNTFQVDISMLSVDVNQKYRETPKKEKANIDPTIVMCNAARTTPFLLDKRGTEGGSFMTTQNVRFGTNTLVSKLMLLYFMTYYVLPKAPIKDIDGNVIYPLTGFTHKNTGKIDDDLETHKYYFCHYIYEIALTVFSREFMGPLMDELSSAALLRGTNQDMNLIMDKYITKLSRDFTKALRTKPEQVALFHSFMGVPQGQGLENVFADPSRNYTYISPLPTGKYSISSKFQKDRLDPVEKKELRDHKGIDLSATEGTKVTAPLAGKVIRSYLSSTYGNTVMIYHNQSGQTTLYAHMNKREVSSGQEVKAGDKLGEVGNTGRSDGNHLHFEIRDVSFPENEVNWTGGGWTKYEQAIAIDPETTTNFIVKTELNTGIPNITGGPQLSTVNDPFLRSAEQTAEAKKALEDFLNEEINTSENPSDLEIMNRPSPKGRVWVSLATESGVVVDTLSFLDYYKLATNDKAFYKEGNWDKISLHHGNVILSLKGQGTKSLINKIFQSYVQRDMTPKDETIQIDNEKFANSLNTTFTNPKTTDYMRQELSTCFFGEIKNLIYDDAEADGLLEWLAFASTKPKNMDIVRDILYPGFIEVFKELRKTNLVDSYFTLTDSFKNGVLANTSNSMTLGALREIKRSVGKIKSLNQNTQFDDEITSIFRSGSRTPLDVKIGGLLSSRPDEKSKAKISDKIRNRTILDDILWTLSKRSEIKYDNFLRAIYSWKTHDIEIMNSTLNSIPVGKLRSLVDDPDIKQLIQGVPKVNSTAEKRAMSTILFADYAFDVVMDLYFSIYDNDEPQAVTLSKDKFKAAVNILKGVQIRDCAAHNNAPRDIYIPVTAAQSRADLAEYSKNLLSGKSSSASKAGNKSIQGSFQKEITGIDKLDRSTPNSINTGKFYLYEKDYIIDPNSTSTYSEKDEDLAPDLRSRLLIPVADLPTNADLVSKSNFVLKNSLYTGYKKAAILTYRFIDNITMNLIFPILATFNDDSSFSDTIEMQRKTSVKAAISKLAVVAERVNEQAPSGLKIKNDSLIHPLIISLLSMMADAGIISFYDKYNCYPDRPLPLLHKSQKDRRYTSALQMFTTPDFFIVKDTSYTDMILDDMDQKIGTAQKTIAIEKINGTELNSSQQETKNHIRSIAEHTEGVIRDSENKVIRLIQAYRNQISLGVEMPTDGGRNEQQIKFCWEMYKARTGHYFDENKITRNPEGEITNYGGYVHSRYEPIARYLVVYWFLRNYLSVDKIEDNMNDLATLRTNLFAAKKFLANPTYGEINEYMIKKFRIDVDKDLHVSQGMNEICNELTATEEASYQMNSLKAANRRLSVNRDAFVSSRDMELVKQLINPSAAAYNLNSTAIMRNKLSSIRYKMRKNGVPSTIAMAFPTFKFYIIEEDAKEWLFFNDFYDYSAIKSIKIHENRKDATSTAHLVISNNYGRLTNVIAGRRTNVENPFYVRPSEEEEVNSMMLREGARIQIRLGYNSHLGVDSIVFSGRIQQIQGTNEIIIVAQSDGVELTREVGIGTGTDLVGALGRLTVPWTGKDGNPNKGFSAGSQTNSLLGLVTAILDSAKLPLRGMGTRAPFLGASRIRNVTGDDIQGINTTQSNYGYLSNAAKWVGEQFVKEITGAIPSMIDTRLTNVNINPSDGVCNFFETLFGKTRWLLYNETIWDALQDLTLQLGNRITTVRTFDEENTLVIDTEDGVYQQSLENYPIVSKVYPIINELNNGEKSASEAIRIISDLLYEEERLSNGRSTYALIVRANIRYFMLETLRGLYQDNPAQDGASFAEAIEAKLDGVLDSLTGEYRSLVVKGLVASRTVREDQVDGKKVTVYSEGLAYKLDNAAADTLQNLHDRISSQTTRGNATTNEFSLEQYILAYSASGICKFLKHSIASSFASFRVVSDFHLKTSHKHIIQNNIKVVKGYNRVEMSYLYEDVIGSVLQVFAMDTIGSLMGFGQAIRLDNINKPESYETLQVVASRTITADKQFTYGTTQKNAGIRGSVLIDYPQIAANSILANLIRDYYDGEIIMLLDPTIKPYDIIYIHDTVNDMWGMIQVKSVTHSFAPETGAVTVVTPDLYVKTSQDGTKTMYSGTSLASRYLKASSSAIITIASIFLGAGAGKILGRVATPFISKFGAVANMFKKPVIKNGLKLIRKGSSGKAAKQFRKAYGKKATQAVFKAAKDAAVREGKEALFDKKIIKEVVEQLNETLSKSKFSASQIDDIVNKLANSADGVSFDHLIKALKQIPDNAGPADKALKALLEKEAKSIMRGANRNPRFDADVISKDKEISKIMERIDKGLDSQVKTQLNNVEQGASDAVEKLGLKQKEQMVEDARDKLVKTLAESDSLVAKSEHVNRQAIINKVDDFFSVGKNFAKVSNPFNLLTMKALGPMISLGLSRRLGSFLLPNFETFSMMLGEYLNYQPITIAGLIHKGEPLIANLDGIKRFQTDASLIEFMKYKVGESFNGFKTLLGDLESTLYNTETNLDELI